MKCPKCGYDEDFVSCIFCDNEAEFEGWYRVRDFAGIPTGMMQKIQVCKDHACCLIGNEKKEDNR